MNIVVCIKHVPAQTDVRVDQATGQLRKEGVNWVINPWDEYAVEAGLRIKEQLPGSTVTVITFGGPNAEGILRDTIALGVDKGILLTAAAWESTDSMATSKLLAAAIKKLGNTGLVICGRYSTDGNTGQVGPALAAQLQLPHIAFVKKLEEIKEDSLRVQRTTEGGYDVLEAKPPLLMTVVKEINEPRTPSLKGKMAAKKAEITKWGLSDLGISEDQIGAQGSATVISQQSAPPSRPKGQTITGSPQEKASTLVKNLHDQGLI